MKYCALTETGLSLHVSRKRLNHAVRYAIFAGVTLGISAGPCSFAQETEPALLRVVPTSIKAEHQTSNNMYEAQLVNGALLNFRQAPLPASAHGIDATTSTKKIKFAPITRHHAIAASLENFIDNSEKTNSSLAPIDVIVTFREEIAIPRFPSAKENERRDSLNNMTAMRNAAQLVDDIKTVRAPTHARRAHELVTQFGAAIKGQFWLTNAMHVHMPIGQIRALAQRQDVQSIDALQLNSAPPPSHYMLDARSVMATDNYFNLPNMASGYIGLLDSGADPVHTLLNHYSWVRDCVNGGSDCNTGVHLNPNDEINHGTSSASILVGNNNLGNNNRGITGMYLDSFKIYNAGKSDEVAAIYGFETALLALDRVIVTELQDYCDENSALAAAADAAYDAGATVVVAAGNYGNAAMTVACPGNARKVLTVGAADVSTLALETDSGRGPTNDGRTKPDVLGPTHVLAASSMTSTMMHSFGGTSAATPNVGGAASLMRNYMRGTNLEYEPGQIYAFMINAGRAADLAAYDNNNGAGLVTLPSNGRIWWGSVIADTANLSTIDVPLSITVTTQNLTASLWWPENIGGNHNDVDMMIINPAGAVVAGSSSTNGVWEKAQVPNSKLYSGNWKLRIRSYRVINPQKVYYAINLQ